MTVSRANGFAIGIVQDVDDATHQGRIKVRLPTYDDIVTDWISVVAPFAGNDRGIFFMPEAGDEVLVGFLNGNFDQPFVLGAMWNGQAAGPSTDPRQRMIRSKNGHTIRFVDSTPTNGNLGALIVEDAHGNRIVMTNSFVSVTATETLLLEAKTVVIRGPGWTRVVQPNGNPV